MKNKAIFLTLLAFFLCNFHAFAGGCRKVKRMKAPRCSSTIKTFYASNKNKVRRIGAPSSKVYSSFESISIKKQRVREMHEKAFGKK